MLRRIPSWCVLVTQIVAIACGNVTLPTTVREGEPAGSAAILVVHRATGDPLEGVIISVNSTGEQGLRVTFTDSNGFATLSDVSAGFEEVRVLQIGYRPQTIQVNRTQMAAPLLVELEPAKVELHDCVFAPLSVSYETRRGPDERSTTVGQVRDQLTDYSAVSFVITGGNDGSM